MKNMKSSNLTKPNWRKSAMKGVTPIVAIIILLLITIALAGAAYTYLSQYFTGLTGKVIQMQDFLCVPGGTGNAYNVTITFKNIGTQTVTTCVGNYLDVLPVDTPQGTSKACGDLTITKTAGGPLNDSFKSSGTVATTVNAGETTVFTDQCNPATLCSYRIITAGTALGAIAPSVQC